MMRLLALLSGLLSAFVAYSLAADDGDSTLIVCAAGAAVLSLVAAAWPRRREPASGYSSTLSPGYSPAVSPAPAVDALSPQRSHTSTTLTPEQRLLVVHKLQQRKKSEAVRDVRSWTGLSAKEARGVVDRIERVV